MRIVAILKGTSYKKHTFYILFYMKQKKIDIKYTSDPNVENKNKITLFNHNFSMRKNLFRFFITLLNA